MAEWWEAEEYQSVEPEPEPGKTEPAGEWWEAEEYTATEPAPEESSLAEDVKEWWQKAEPGVVTVADALRSAFMRTYVAPAEVGAAIIGGAVAEPVAGMAGALETAARLPFQGRDRAVREGAATVESIRGGVGDFLAPNSAEAQEYMELVGTALEPVGAAMNWAETSLGEGVMEATGSPGLAAIAHTMPTAALEALGLGLLKKTSKAADVAIRAAKKGKIHPTLTPDRRIREVVDQIEPEGRTHMDIVADLKAKKTKAVAADVRPDAEIVAAAEDLGVDLNPSHYSTNEAYRRVEQAIKQQPGSLLAERELAAIETLGKRADEMIEEFAGDIDKNLLEKDVQSHFQTTIKDMEDGAERLYGLVNEHGLPSGARGGIPPKTRMMAATSRAYIDDLVDGLGGDLSGLTAAQKQLYDVMNGEVAPTWKRFDTMRRDIGDGYKNKGAFKDDATGELDQVYKVLITDQQFVADAMNVGEEFAAARQLVAKRKKVEKQAEALIGKELDKSVLPAMKSASTGLTGGSTAKLESLMRALPPSMRQRTAATMLNHIFTSGARTGGSLGQGFVKAFDALERYPSAKKALFDNLPADALQRFDAIGKVSRGIYRAKALGEGSPTARLIMGALESLSMVGKITGTAARPIGAAVGTGLGVGPIGGDVLSAATKVGAKRAERADKLMSSATFEKSMNLAAEGKVKQAEILLNRSKVWQAWRRTLGEGTKAQLLAMGPIAWLTQQDEPAVPPEFAQLTQAPAVDMPPDQALQPPMPQVGAQGGQ